MSDISETLDKLFKNPVPIGSTPIGIINNSSISGLTGTYTGNIGSYNTLLGFGSDVPYTELPKTKEKKKRRSIDDPFEVSML